MAGAVLLSGAVSCNKFLDQEPMSSIAPEAYFSTESQVEAVLMQEYQSILPGASLARDNNTDNQQGTNIANKYTSNLWKVPASDSNWDFSGLYYLNFFFEQVLPKFEAGEISGNQDKIKHMIGEVYFLRAFWYFDKLQAFGDYPIVTEVLPDDLAVLTEASKRSPRNEVARFILNDLDTAIRYMEGVSLTRSRINVDAAYLFKSRVALYEGTWLKYFKGTAFVPGTAEWPGAKATPSYSFPSGSIDSEIDWFLTQSKDAAKIVGDKYAGSLTANPGHLPQTSADAPNPYYEMFASEDQLDNYPEVLLWRDYAFKKANHSMAVQAGRGNGMVGLTRACVQNFLMADGTPVYAHGTYSDGDGHYLGDKTLTDVRQNRDGRLFLFLKSKGQINGFKNLDDLSGNEFVEVEPAPDILGADNDRSYATGYSIRKGCSESRSQFCLFSSYTDFVIFRAAEALLNYMEASYELTGSLDGTATSYWKALRQRAKTSDDLNATIAATNMEKEAEFDWAAYSGGQVLTDNVLYNIRRERRMELLSEGFRDMDLHRWRSMDQLIAKPYHFEGFHLWNTPMEEWYAGRLIEGPTDPNANVSSKSESEYLRLFQKKTGMNGFNGATWKMAHYLSPIAVNHLLITSESGTDAASSVIYQNPYWPTAADQSATK